MTPVQLAAYLGRKIGYKRLAKWSAFAVAGLVAVAILGLPLIVGAVVAANEGSDDGGGDGFAPCVPIIGPGKGDQYPLNLDDQGVRNAVTIIARSIRAGVDKRGATIAIATSAVETGGTIHPLTYGHLDSLGLFQQRPSVGWGTREDVLDPVKSSDAFLGVSTHTKNPGLVDIQGWRNMPLTQAAQAVQHSATPTAYAHYEQAATSIVGQLWARAQADPLAGGHGSASTPTAQPAAYTSSNGETPVSGGCGDAIGGGGAGTPATCGDGRHPGSTPDGAVVYAARCWFGGHGVDIRASASLHSSYWQCTELVRRLWWEKGWADRKSWNPRGGNVMWLGQGPGAPGAVSLANGKINRIGAGDIVSIDWFHGGVRDQFGHTGAVNAVIKRGDFYEVEMMSQNTPDAIWRLRWDGKGTLSMPQGWSGFKVAGILHRDVKGAQ